jgi:hypothetical protein
MTNSEIVALFAEEMVARLNRNNSRGAVPRTAHDLLSDLQLCCIKLESAVEAYDNGQVSASFVAGEAADVANFALLIHRNVIEGGDR